MEELRISVASDATDSSDVTVLEELVSWLGQEAALRGQVRLASPALENHQMGSLADAVVVAAGSGGALTVLAGSLSVWLRQQRSHLKVSIRRVDGAELTLDASNVKNPEEVLGSFLGDAR